MKAIITAIKKLFTAKQTTKDEHERYEDRAG